MLLIPREMKFYHLKIKTPFSSSIWGKIKTILRIYKPISE